MYKVGIWGQFGDGGPIADGQAVRTTIITKEVERKYGCENVLRVNTNNWKKRPIQFLWESLMLAVKSKNVVIFPADNGFKTYVPLLTILNKVLHRNLLYVVIGGFLPSLLSRDKKYIKMLNQFSAMFVQTENIKNDLEELGLTNIRYITNLKRIEPVAEETLCINNSDCIKVCLFSRITENKGVLDAIEAVRLANEKIGEIKIQLDMYGIVADNFKDTFEEALLHSKGFVNYKGVVDYDKTVQVLKNYFALLFPTYFHGEGFPGCFIDAFNSGLPIIATDWLYNHDLVTPGDNGLLVPIKDPQALCDAILKLYYDRELAYTLSKGSWNMAKEYEPDSVLADFYDAIV